MNRFLLGLGLCVVSSLTIPSVANAGFLSSLAGGLVANSMSDSANRAAMRKERERQKLETLGSELWRMHKNKSYYGSFMDDANWVLNNTNEIGYLDTVAQVYADNDNGGDAIDIYNYRILPNCADKCTKYKNKYKQLTKRVDRNIVLNQELWHMHKKNKYTNNAMKLVKELEKKSSDIGQLDTVAWVYMDNGYAEKAIDLYKTRILPKCSDECEKFQGYYKKLQTAAETQKMATQ